MTPEEYLEERRSHRAEWVAVIVSVPFWLGLMGLWRAWWPLGGLGFIAAILYLATCGKSWSAAPLAGILVAGFIAALNSW